MITSEKLAQVADAARRDASVASLRLSFADLHFTECSEDDVSPLYHPAASIEGYDLFLISGSSGHCLELTNTLEAATGILVAAKVDEQ